MSEKNETARSNEQTLVMLRNDIQTLRVMTQVQCDDGNWNYDPYIHGMANGLIFALSIFDKNEPNYLEALKEWLADKPCTKEKTCEPVTT